METLSKANQARAEKALNKLWNFSEHGITSFKKLIDNGVFVKAEEELKPELQYNRQKFNRMTNFRGEQDEYYRRCTEKTKKSYSLYYADNTFTEVSKFVYDYFIEVQQAELQEKCFECGKKMTDLEHNYGTEDFLVCIHCYNDPQQATQEELNHLFKIN